MVFFFRDKSIFWKWFFNIFKLVLNFLGLWKRGFGSSCYILVKFCD